MDVLKNVFNFCFVLEHNNDLNTLKLLQIYIQLIQDDLIDVNHLITPLQFVNMVRYCCNNEII